MSRDSLAGRDRSHQDVPTFSVSCENAPVRIRVGKVCREISHTGETFGRGGRVGVAALESEYVRIFGFFHGFAKLRSFEMTLLVCCSFSLLLTQSSESCTDVAIHTKSVIEKEKTSEGAEDNLGSRKFRDFLQEWPTPGTGPYFDTSINSNITGLVGKTVLLHCRVKNLGNRTVSWVRHRDIHLLTVGRYTYTSDQRFEAVHTPHTEEWTLRLRYPQKKDSGIYECQISTTPPVGHFVFLTIVEPITEILGSPELFINLGSTINLTCVVRYAPEPHSNIAWAQNSELINFDSPRGGISLVTEKGLVTTSRLLIQKAGQKDSGLYTCTPSKARTASVRVHILNGEHPAAMHHGHGSLTRLSHVTLLLGLVILLILRPPT